jgi:hypothetical protein
MEPNNPNTLTPDTMVAQLRAWREQVPDYSQLTPAQSKAIISVSAISHEMVTAAANAIGESPVVQSAAGTTIDEVRQMSADANAWATLEEELAATYRGVRTANRLRRHRLGMIALTTYAVSGTLIRKPEHVSLIPHVEAMRRANRFGRKRRSSEETPKPEPAPQPSPSAPAHTMTN